MSKKEEKVNNDPNNQEAGQAAPEENNASKSKPNWLMRILVVVGVVIFQLGASYFLVSTLLVPKSSQADVTKDESKKPVKDKVEDEAPDEESKDDLAGGVFHIADIIINPAGSYGKRYMILSMAIVVKEEKDIAELQKKEPILKDRVISILSRRTVGWFAEPMNREYLRKEILAAIRKVTKCHINQIYFTKYVLQ